MNKLPKKEEDKESLKERIKLFLNNSVVLWLIVINLLTSSLIWTSVLFFLGSVDGRTILHYNVYFGVDAAGNQKNALILPIVGLLILFFNVILAAFFYDRKQRIISHILLMAAFMAELNLLIATLALVLINY